jgi:hypothetical protein
LNRGEPQSQQRRALPCDNNKPINRTVTPRRAQAALIAPQWCRTDGSTKMAPHHVPTQFRDSIVSKDMGRRCRSADYPYSSAPPDGGSVADIDKKRTDPSAP